MKTIFLLLTILVISRAENFQGDSGEEEISNEDEQSEDTIKIFEKKIQKTLEHIRSNTKDVVEIVEKAIEQLEIKTENDLKGLLRDSHEIVWKFNEIKAKTSREIKKCKGKYLGESSVLSHLLALKDEIEYSAKEVRDCPPGIEGVECLINTMVRGETMMDEADGLIEAEKGTPTQRVEALMEWIGKCNKNTIEATTTRMQKFISELQNCTK